MPPSRLSDGRDGLLGEEELSALLPVDERAPEDPSVRQRPPEVRVELPGVRAGLEDARRASERLAAGEPGRLLEGRVDVLDPAGAVGDDHRVGRRFHHVRQELALLDPAPGGGGVAQQDDTPFDPPAGVADRRRVDAEPDPRRRLPADEEHLEVGDDLAAQRLYERHLAGRVGCHHVRPEAAEGLGPSKRRHLRGVPPEQPASGGIGEEAASVAARDDDAVGETLDGVPERDGRRANARPRPSAHVHASPSLHTVLATIPRLGKRRGAVQYLVPPRRIGRARCGSVADQRRSPGSPKAAVSRVS